MHQLARHSNSHTSMTSVRPCLESKERHGCCQRRQQLNSHGGKNIRRNRCLDYVEFITTAHCWHYMWEHLNQAHQTEDKVVKSLFIRPTALPMGRNLKNTVIHIPVQNFLPDNGMKTECCLQGQKYLKQILSVLIKGIFWKRVIENWYINSFV